MGGKLGFLLFALVVLAACADTFGKRNSTGSKRNRGNSLEDDDADFGISILDDTPPVKKNDTNKKLAEAIVGAVVNFTKSNRFNLGALLYGGGLDSVIGVTSLTTKKPKHKRSADVQPDKSDADKDSLDLGFDDFVVDEKEAKKLKEENEDIFKELHGDLGDDGEFDKAFGEPETSEMPGFQSYINKIPRRQILSRQVKSLDSNLLKSDQEVSEEPFDDDDVKINSNVTGIENLLEVYTAKGLIENWNTIRETLTPGCRRGMAQYLRGITNLKFWALKMDDATGRYSSGYYWGNGYWTGSATLCTEELPSLERKRDHMNNSVARHNGVDVMERVPFEVAFFSAKVQFNSSSAIIGPDVVQIGLCLPEKCVASDITRIIEMSGARGNPRVVGIRDPKHNHYDIFSDLTFQILVGVSVTVFVLIMAGTIYELILRMRIKKSLSTLKLNNQPIKIDMKSVTDMPSIKISNGKSIYNFNGISNNNNNSEERLNIEPLQADEQLQLGVFSELILSFSVISNMKTICDQSVGSDTIPTIHGLRSISMVWVILGHCCIVAFKYSDNTELRKVVEKEFFFQTVTNATFSVDTFFCISGILVSYIYFRTNAKGSLDRLTQGTRGFTSGLLQFIGLLAYRFARLTAPYLFMLGVVEVSMKWFYYNSVFDPPTQDHINCPNYWWRNVLYVNTLFPVEQMCMLWSWYLADDSQFYVLGAIILILAASHFKTAAGALAVFLVSSWATTGYIAWSNNHMPSIEDPLALFDKIYDKPWTRLGPYLVGMAAGWLLFKTNCKIKMSKAVVLIGWTLSIAVLLCIVYGLYDSELSPITAAAYTSLSHTAWALSVAWIVVACSTGYGGYVNSLLSATILYPFSRVTYCAYLVHPIVIRFLPMHLDHPIHLGKDMMTIIFLGQMVTSYLLSFIISLAFEAPVVTMLKILAPNKRKKLQ